METYIFNPLASGSDARYLSGSLEASSGILVEYWPVEISNYKLSIYSKVNVKSGDSLYFNLNNDTRIELRVDRVINLKVARIPLIKMTLVTKEQQLEACMQHISELKGWTINTLKEENHRVSSDHLALRAARINSASTITVKAKTFGTPNYFSLTTKNVSKSGMLIENFSKLDTVPFGVNTIIEIKIDPAEEKLKQSVTCLAKVIRRETTQRQDQHSSEFGIKLIEMTPEQVDTWAEFVETQERQLFDQGALVA